jgi:hypothetical protein
MADVDVKAAPAKSTIRGSIATVNAKIVLAFFLTIIASGLVVFLTLILVYAPTGKFDAGAIALISSMITLFIKQAADATGYQFTSSSGSDKKDDTQANATKALADKVQPPPGAPVIPVATSPPWWPKFTDDEKSAIVARGKLDARVAAFITAAQVGAANGDDLVHLVQSNLLTPARATVIAAS